GGGDEAHSDFSAQYAGFYHEAVELLMQAGRSEQAFHVVERYRARGLLAMLAERELVFSADVPPELDRERRLANAEYDRALARRGAAQGDRAAERAGLVQARRRQAAVEERIRAASPRLAALQYPEPLDLEGARRALDPGTLLLSYVIGDTKSYVFAVGPGPEEFQLAPLATDRGRL